MRIKSYKIHYNHVKYKERSNKIKVADKNHLN
jgi:hypothetical protein